MDFLRNGGQSADNRDFLYRLYYPLCVSRRIDTWQIVYLSYNYKPGSLTLSYPVQYQFIKVRLRYIQFNVPRAPMDSDGTCPNSHVSAASCKLVPLGRATFWMLKLVNFHRCPWCPWGIKVGTLENRDPYSISKLSANLPSINSARYTQRIIQMVKSRLATVSEKSTSFRPARSHRSNATSVKAAP